jgi:hypothetical protein
MKEKRDYKGFFFYRRDIFHHQGCNVFPEVIKHKDVEEKATKQCSDGQNFVSYASLKKYQSTV